jgi:hypothetical protein
MYAFLKSRQAANALQRVVCSALVVCVVTGCDGGVSTESVAPEPDQAARNFDGEQ